MFWSSTRDTRKSNRLSGVSPTVAIAHPAMRSSETGRSLKSWETVTCFWVRPPVGMLTTRISVPLNGVKVRLGNETTVLTGQVGLGHAELFKERFFRLAGGYLKLGFEHVTRLGPTEWRVKSSQGKESWELKMPNPNRDWAK